MGFASGTGPVGRTRWLYPSYGSVSVELSRNPSLASDVSVGLAALTPSYGLRRIREGGQRRTCAVPTGRTNTADCTDRFWWHGAKSAFAHPIRFLESIAQSCLKTQGSSS